MSLLIKRPHAGKEKESGNAGAKQLTATQWRKFNTQQGTTVISTGADVLVWTISANGKVTSRPKEDGCMMGQPPEPVTATLIKKKAKIRTERTATQWRKFETVDGVTTISTGEEQQVQRGDKQRQQRQAKASRAKTHQPWATQWRMFTQQGNLQVVSRSASEQETEEQAREQKARLKKEKAESARAAYGEREQVRSMHAAGKRQRENVRRRIATRRKQILCKAKAQRAVQYLRQAFQAWRGAAQRQQLVEKAATKREESRVQQGFRAWKAYRVPIRPGTAVRMDGIKMSDFTGLNSCYATVEQQVPSTSRYRVRVRSGPFQGQTCTIVRQRLTPGRGNTQAAWAAGQSRWEHGRVTGQPDRHTGQWLQRWTSGDVTNEEVSGMEDHIRLGTGTGAEQRKSILFQEEDGKRLVAKVGHGGLEVVVQDGEPEMDMVFGPILAAVDPCGVRRIVYAPMTAELTEEQLGLDATQLQWTLKDQGWQRNDDAKKMTLPEEMQRYVELKRLSAIGEVISTLEAAIGTEEMEEATKNMPDNRIGVCGRVHRLRRSGDDAVRELALCPASMKKILANAAVPACEAQKLRGHKDRMEQFAEAAKVAYKHLFFIMRTERSAEKIMNAVGEVTRCEQGRANEARNAFVLAITLHGVHDPHDTEEALNVMATDHINAAALKTPTRRLWEDRATLRKEMMAQSRLASQTRIDGATVVLPGGCREAQAGIRAKERPATPEDTLTEIQKDTRARETGRASAPIQSIKRGIYK